MNNTELTRAWNEHFPKHRDNRGLSRNFSRILAIAPAKETRVSQGPAGVHSVNSICATRLGFNHCQFCISIFRQAH